MESKFEIKKRKSKVKEANLLKESNVSYGGIVAIAILSFALGIGWYIPGGIVPELSYTYGVSISDGNLSLTLYLAGLVIAAPLVATFFYKIRRKNIIIWASVLYVVANIIIAFSTNFSELLFFRFMCGLGHGGFLAIGTLMASAMAPKDKRGLVLAIIFSSLFAATFTIVPIFTFVSTLGWSSTDPSTLHNLTMVKQNWRWGFFFTACISLVSLILVLFFVPKDLHLTGDRNIKKEVTILWYWPFMLDMLFCILIFLVIFIIYPLLQELWVADDGFGLINSDQSLLALLLAVYGICSFIGNQGGGFFADGKTFPAIYLLLIAFILDIVLLTISCAFRSAGAILAFTLLLPIIGYTMLPNIYAIGYNLARYHDKSENIDFSSGIVGFMIGIGAIIGTSICGPITQNPINPQEFDPTHFIYICYIVLAALIVAFFLIIPIHWYVMSSEIIVNKNKFINKIFKMLPIYIDRYHKDGIDDYIKAQLAANPKRKIIDKRIKK